MYIFLFLVYCVASSSSFEEQLVSKFSNDDKKVALLDASLCVYDASWLRLLMVTKRTQNWSDLLKPICHFDIVPQSQSKLRQFICHALSYRAVPKRPSTAVTFHY